MSKVLIVEDDKNIALAIAVQMRRKGHETVHAQDAVMAVSAAVRERPDLVLLDISMPGGNGFRVAQRLQDNVKTAGTPMIFMTASREQALREKAESLGCCAFIQKPFQGAALSDAVDAALA